LAIFLGSVIVISSSPWGRDSPIFLKGNPGEGACQENYFALQNIFKRYGTQYLIINIG
jgi:hypothetical protein